MRIAIVHYWLVRMRGGEQVLEALCDMYPQADIFTHVAALDSISAKLRRHRIKTSFTAKLPRARYWYKKYLPLMPIALEQLDMRGYDLIISSESGPAKGIVPPSIACMSAMSILRCATSGTCTQITGRRQVSSAVSACLFFTLLANLGRENGSR